MQLIDDFFSLNGEINRKNYTIYNIFIALFAFIFGFFFLKKDEIIQISKLFFSQNLSLFTFQFLISLIFLALIFYIKFILNIKRLRSLKKSPFWIILLYLAILTNSFLNFDNFQKVHKFNEEIILEKLLKISDNAMQNDQISVKREFKSLFANFSLARITDYIILKSLLNIFIFAFYCYLFLFKEKDLT